MESYIVRIYRRLNNDTDDLHGIVERPDNGENKTFKSVEELYAIFSPPEKITGENKLKQIIEQRKFRRFKIKEGTLTFNSTTDVGEITDISMGGLSFHSSNILEDYISSVDVGILCGEKKCCAHNIRCKNIISHDGQKSPAFSNQQKNRRFSVEFDELTAPQKSQLRHIIQNHTRDEA